MKNKIIATALTTAAVAAGTLMVAAPAHADTAGCVTRAEFRHVKHGMTVAAVKRIYDTGGKVSVSSASGGYRMVIRDYNACGAFHVTNVSFQANPGRQLTVSGKTYI